MTGATPCTSTSSAHTAAPATAIRKSLRLTEMPTRSLSELDSQCAIDKAFPCFQYSLNCFADITMRSAGQGRPWLAPSLSHIHRGAPTN